MNKIKNQKPEKQFSILEVEAPLVSNQFAFGRVTVRGFFILNYKTPGGELSRGPAFIDKVTFDDNDVTDFVDHFLQFDTSGEMEVGLWNALKNKAFIKSLSQRKPTDASYLQMEKTTTFIHEDRSFQLSVAYTIAQLEGNREHTVCILNDILLDGSSVSDDVPENIYELIFEDAETIVTNDSGWNSLIRSITNNHPTLSTVVAI